MAFEIPKTEKEILERIKILEQEKKLKQEKLAELAAMQNSTVSIDTTEPIDPTAEPVISPTTLSHAKIDATVLLEPDEETNKNLTQAQALLAQIKAKRQGFTSQVFEPIQQTIVTEPIVIDMPDAEPEPVVQTAQDKEPEVISETLNQAQETLKKIKELRASIQTTVVAPPVTQKPPTVTVLPKTEEPVVPKTASNTSRRKFLKNLFLGGAAIAATGTGIGSFIAGKKTQEAQDDLEDAQRTIEDANNTVEKAKRELEEQKRAEQEKIKALVEQMDMPFFKSLSYAGRIIYLSFMGKYENYLMVDKAKAELYVINLYGSHVTTESVVLGRIKGETLNEVTLKHDPDTYGTTPSTVYELSFDLSPQAKAEFGDKAIHMLQVGMEEESNLYIHPILPSEYKRRMAAIQSPNPEDNRMSWGCINVPDIESILPYVNVQEINKTQKTKLVVLPDRLENGTEMWMDPDMGTFYPVGEGESEYKDLLTKIEEYANIDSNIV